jgi:hypothetical protein
MTDIGSNQLEQPEDEDYAESFRSIIDILNPSSEVDQRPKLKF